MFSIHQLFFLQNQSRSGGAVHQGAGARLYQVQIVQYILLKSRNRISA